MEKIVLFIYYYYFDRIQKTLFKDEENFVCESMDLCRSTAEFTV